MSFEQNINFAIKNYLHQQGFTASENPLYFFKILQGGVLTFVIEKTEDKNAEDAHQKFDAFLGLSCFALEKVKVNQYPPFISGHTPEVRIWISGLKKFNGMALEVKSNTDWKRFGERLTENIELALHDCRTISTTDEILEWLLLKDSHMVNVYDYPNVPVEYNFGMRLFEYVRMNKRYDLIDKYIRNCDYVKQGVAESKIDEAGIKSIITKACRTMRQIQQDNFAPLVLPESFGKVCDWIDKNNYYTTISGLFEINCNGKSTMQHWIEDKKIADRFGVFGSLPNGDMICAWLQDNGSMPIVWIGGGGTTYVIAKDFEDFIALLAIGYYEFWSADKSIAPIWENENQQKDFGNIAFQEYYKSKFAKPILPNGKTIVDGVKTCDDLREWLLENYAPWKEM